jgi:hypothetical protein
MINSSRGELIRSITLTQEAANQAFAEFLSKQNLTAPPFTTVGRITEIFPLEDALRIMHVLESIKENAVRIS